MLSGLESFFKNKDNLTEKTFHLEPTAITLRNVIFDAIGYRFVGICSKNAFFEVVVFVSTKEALISFSAREHCTDFCAI